MTLFVRTRREGTSADPNTLFVSHPQNGADMCQPHRKVETNKVCSRGCPPKAIPALSTGTNKVSLRGPTIPRRSQAAVKRRRTKNEQGSQQRRNKLASFN